VVSLCPRKVVEGEKAELGGVGGDKKRGGGKGGGWKEHGILRGDQGRCFDRR